MSENCPNNENNMAEDMAEAESKENPFSFKTFVKCVRRVRIDLVVLSKRLCLAFGFSTV